VTDKLSTSGHHVTTDPISDPGPSVLACPGNPLAGDAESTFVIAMLARHTSGGPEGGVAISINRKPVLSIAEGSAIRNLKSSCPRPGFPLSFLLAGRWLFSRRRHGDAPQSPKRQRGVACPPSVWRVCLVGFAIVRPA